MIKNLFNPDPIAFQVFDFSGRVLTPQSVEIRNNNSCIKETIGWANEQQAIAACEKTFYRFFHRLPLLFGNVDKRRGIASRRWIRCKRWFPPSTRYLVIQKQARFTPLK